MLGVLAASDPSIPMNSGAFDAVDFIMPPGKVVSPEHPATVNHYFPTSHLVYNCVLAALGRFNPARAVAPSGLGTGAIAVGYTQGRAGKRTVQYELMITALGGTNDNDGAAIILPMIHYVPGTPVEVVETEYPAMIQRFDIRTDSAGAGRHRGGTGFVREYKFLTDCILTARVSNHKYGAWGVFGGKNPTPSRTAIESDGTTEDMDVLETRQIRSGAVVSLEQSGGGGYGDPLERLEEYVLEDVRNGYVSRTAAAEIYGVVITDDGKIDAGATAKRRAGA